MKTKFFLAFFFFVTFSFCMQVQAREELECSTDNFKKSSYACTGDDLQKILIACQTGGISYRSDNINSRNKGYGKLQISGKARGKCTFSFIKTQLEHETSTYGSYEYKNTTNTSCSVPEKLLSKFSGTDKQYCKEVETSNKNEVLINASLRERKKMYNEECSKDSRSKICIAYKQLTNAMIKACFPITKMKKENLADCTMIGTDLNQQFAWVKVFAGSNKANQSKNQ